MVEIERNLGQRAEMILAAVIDMYVKSGLPVGSVRLCEMHELPWSSATIRHEMALMEEAGFLTHAHTSSGRLPTSKGIRYFVDYLLVFGVLPEGIKRRIEDEFGRAGGEPLRLMYVVSRILSHFSRQVSVVQAFSENGNNFLIDGMENFLGLPEFADSIKLKDLFHVLEEEEVHNFIFRRTLTSRDVSVLIGSDLSMSEYQELFEDVSVVASAFGRSGKTMGAVGVVGPKRMDYRRMIPLVNYTAHSIGQKLQQVY